MGVSSWKQGHAVIISASRRTDIAAFYSDWFMNRIRAGYCAVPNPMNPRQVARVSLAPEDVTAVIFWTRSPTPLLAHLPELEARGFRYYFQITLLDSPRELDHKTPPLQAAVNAFQTLADRIGAERVIWRYDPIVYSSLTPPAYHIDKFGQIAALLNGYTQRSVISVVDHYRKVARRVADLRARGIDIYEGEAVSAMIAHLMPALAATAAANGMALESCAETHNLTSYGIRPGKCVDDALIRRGFGIDVTTKKDPAQRAACGCVQSRDIGMYDTCLFGCQYCYATSSFDRARANHRAHDPHAAALIGDADVASPDPVQRTLPW
jgi:hypothetical protein